jgi:hypothetical protein
MYYVTVDKPAAGAVNLEKALAARIQKKIGTIDDLWTLIACLKW